jgi:hypothetical protein
MLPSSDIGIKILLVLVLSFKMMTGLSNLIQTENVHNRSSFSSISSTETCQLHCTISLRIFSGSRPWTITHSTGIITNMLWVHLHCPGQFSTMYPDILQPCTRGRFHFAGELASHSHAWVAGALDLAVRAVDAEIICMDFLNLLDKFEKNNGRSSVFSNRESADQLFIRGLYSKETEAVGF